MSDRRLPRRDFLLIPLIALLTGAVLAGVGEVLARAAFAERGAETCVISRADGVAVMRPNCVSHRKAAEGPDTEYVYNDCGYRTPEACAPRSPGSIRVALIGASSAQGFKVPYKETFAARLTEALSRACGRPVEFQNLGVAGLGLVDTYRRLDEALALKPDLVMWVLTPYDLKPRVDPRQLAERDNKEYRPAPAGPAAVAPLKSLVARLSDLAFNSRLLVAAQHYLFEDRPSFVRLFMLHGEDADYLRVPFSAGWEARLRDFGTLVGEMAARDQASGVPTIVVLGPQRIQAALLDPSVLPPGVDPYEIGRRLSAAASAHGVLFLDALPTFAEEDDPDSFFYAVDGHLDGRGNGVLALAIEERLLSDGVLPGCAQTRAGQ